jgi:hypothetical protein
LGAAHAVTSAQSALVICGLRGSRREAARSLRSRAKICFAEFCHVILLHCESSKQKNNGRKAPVIFLPFLIFLEPF